MKLNSQILRGSVLHQRNHPIEHRFQYPMTFFALDLDELEQIEGNASSFGYNRNRLLSIHDKDYLHGHPTPITKQLNRLLPAQHEGERTVLVTSPRYLGYAFNPVNFHLRLRGDELICVVAEVNNTFGERHCYTLRNLRKSGAHTWKAKCPKEFHVSPFNPVKGYYVFTFRIEANTLYLGVDLYENRQCIMRTYIEGTGEAITNGNINRHALLRPFDTALNSMPRILWQAAILHFRKKLGVHKHPEAQSTHTLIRRKKQNQPYAV
ncbi:DUF1365 domain-containing protein [Coraliomargarita akajimensis]|uniref:DUF1365 domain-containing protein n=1 Tax=Coraliomargarita akajimensis (strain DSM 45221 / IAM 15411 / JCM 23193 / KCTC 12865 / 04OKA010-24) TaxID=583355 RepID=D5EJE4_CORAD|nr:DUF1365 domain-containing protein [Coraliomargarita akajimensis]ADE54543.1 protein of unknown function DUF1365 [Coraliomargarita akajimensis DSM 45221]